MAVESDSVPGQQPDKLSVCEYDFSASPARFEEEVESAHDGFDVGWLAFQYKRPCVPLHAILDEPPQHGCRSEKDRRDDEREVVAEVWDQCKRCRERSCGARDLVEDVD